MANPASKIYKIIGKKVKTINVPSDANNVLPLLNMLILHIYWVYQYYTTSPLPKLLNKSSLIPPNCGGISPTLMTIPPNPF
jgi:hypothetical protein